VKNTDRYKLIGSRIKDARESLGMSQVDLAKAVGFESPTAIALIESGDRKVSVAHLEEMSKVLQRDISYFLGKENAAPDVAIALRAAAGLSNKDKAMLLRLYELAKEDTDSE